MHSCFARLNIAATAVTALVLTSLSPSHAVILFGEPDTKYIAPTGEYASIPWGKVAYNIIDDKKNPAWAISPNWALRANHVGGGRTGYAIEQNGVTYTVVESVNVAGSDLELVRVSQPFSSFFNMYRGGDEVGKEIAMFGTSNAGRDDNARVISEGTGRFNGWLAGTPASPQPGESGDLNWGRNQVRGIEKVGSTETLYATFDAPTLPGGGANPHSVGAEEGIVYNGDSGGAFFIQQAGEWRLAGVVYAVDAAYFKESDTQQSLGAIFDARDLWVDEPVDPNFPDGPKKRVRIAGLEPVPFGSYASRVSTYRGSIDAITGQTAGLGVVVPEAGTGQLIMLGSGLFGVAGMVLARRRRRAV